MVVLISSGGALIDAQAQQSYIPVLEVTAPRTEELRREISDLGVSTLFNADALDARVPIGLDDLVGLAPSALVRTNSRGEALVFLRGAGERETTLMLDGVPLNVPWDNRVDLSILPGSLVAQARTTAGPAAIRFGTRTTGGVIELFTTPTDQSGKIASAGVGNANRLQANAMLPFDLDDDHSLLLAGGIARHGDEPVAAPGTLPFSQDRNGGRTNTDRRVAHGYMRLGGEQGRTEWHMSLLHADARYGIAPESDRDPVLTNVRFWRYPDSRYSLFSAGLDRPLTDQWQVSLRGWYQGFAQTIEEFASADYDVLTSAQRDRTNSWGMRGSLAYGDEVQDLRLTTSLYHSQHSERLVALMPPQSLDQIDFSQTEADRFAERFVSVVSDYRRNLGHHTSLTLSAGVDWQDLTESAGRPTNPDFVSLTAAAGVSHRLTEAWTLSLSAGRKNRQPTLRELFGAALNRFVPNPALKSEQNWLLESTIAYTTQPLGLRITPFARWTDDFIEQRVIAGPGPLDQRQRINRDGARVLGLEVQADACISNALAIDVRVTRQWARPRGDGPDTRLAERPSWLVGGGLSWTVSDRGSLRLEGDYWGRAFSADPGGTLTPLPRSVALNLAGQWTVYRDQKTSVTVMARVDNLFDSRIEPQLGLPQPGRWATLRLVFRH